MQPTIRIRPDDDRGYARAVKQVVGAFEAMITKKSYRKPMSLNDAIDEIRNNSGKQFDPAVIHAFMSVIKRKDVIRMLKREIYGIK